MGRPNLDHAVLGGDDIDRPRLLNVASLDNVDLPPTATQMRTETCMHGRNHSDTRASHGHEPNHLGASDEQTEARACHCPCPADCSRLTQLNSPSGHASRSTLLTPFAANRENGQYMPAHKRQMDLHNLPPAQRSEHLSLSLSPSLSLYLPLSLCLSLSPSFSRPIVPDRSVDASAHGMRYPNRRQTACVRRRNCDHRLARTRMRQATNAKTKSGKEQETEI